MFKVKRKTKTGKPATAAEKAAKKAAAKERYRKARKAAAQAP